MTLVVNNSLAIWRQFCLHGPIRQRRFWERLFKRRFINGLTYLLTYPSPTRPIQNKRYQTIVATDLSRFVFLIGSIWVNRYTTMRTSLHLLHCVARQSTSRTQITLFFHVSLSTERTFRNFILSLKQLRASLTPAALLSKLSINLATDRIKYTMANDWDRFVI